MNCTFKMLKTRVDEIAQLQRFKKNVCIRFVKLSIILNKNVCVTGSDGASTNYKHFLAVETYSMQNAAAAPWTAPVSIPTRLSTVPPLRFLCSSCITLTQAS